MSPVVPTMCVLLFTHRRIIKGTDTDNDWVQKDSDTLRHVTPDDYRPSLRHRQPFVKEAPDS